MGSYPNNCLNAVGTCLRKYAVFSGRANRSEYWWFIVFNWLGSGVLLLLDTYGIASSLFVLLMMPPYFAVHARRLHDINKSGWWQLIALIPLIGWLIVLYWVVQKGDAGSNRFD